MNSNGPINTDEKTDRRLLNSLVPGGQDQDDLDWIDYRVHPRLQYRERYYHPGEGPFA